MDTPEPQGDVIRIETPEHVIFEYELAGIGSRIIAAAVDLMVIGLALLVLALVLFLSIGGSLGSVDIGWSVAGAAVTAFVTFWGYPIFFEIYLRGQTPGKRSLGMRVIQEGGYALTPSVVVVRNLLRVVDFLPGAYVLGLVVMMFNRRYKRIGDYVAGTLVIRDRKRSALAIPSLSPQVRVAANPETAADLRRAGVHRLPPAQVQLVEDFLARRSALAAEARRRLALQLSSAVMKQLGVEGVPGEAFLRDVMAAYHESQRQAAGEDAGPPGGGA